MALPSQYIDISTFPPGEQAHVIEIARKHNALAEDVDAISGSTPEEKESSHNLYQKFIFAGKFLHAKRFNAGFWMFMAWLVISTLEKLGVHPEQVSRLFDVVIKILEKIATS